MNLKITAINISWIFFFRFLKSNERKINTKDHFFNLKNSEVIFKTKKLYHSKLFYLLLRKKNLVGIVKLMQCSNITPFTHQISK